ncbi:hypothetical protein GCM10009760_62750 [Kitasatospora kazusensis]|uniref:Uncharacterized protein n=1 Tax=Kitasatospora kazusensis TaxID=407974 RepID=A0ABP4KBU1_9ACTN
MTAPGRPENTGPPQGGPGPGPSYALTGRYRAVRPRVGNGPGHPPAEPVETEVEFAYRPPSSWRLAGAGRVTVTELNHAPWETPGLGYPPGDWPWAFDPSPARLVVHGLTGLPAGPRTVREERPATELEIPGPDGSPLLLVLDDELGIVLSVHGPDGGYVEEITALRLYRTLPDDLFADPDDGAADLADQAELRRYERIRAHYRDRRLPVPAGSWPGPLGLPAPIDGDPDSGFLVLDLDVRPATDRPTGAQLVRQPLPDRPYRAGWAGSPATHLHRWRDAHWQWTLALTGHPLTPDRLAAVAAELAALS